jgi:hypothetical protein
MFDREYYVEQDYNAGYVATLPDSDIQEVRNYSGLRDAIENLVINYAESGTIRTLSYIGDAEDDISRAINYVTRETPLGVFAVDYIRQDVHPYLTYYELTVRIYYKVSKEKIEQTPRFNTLEDMFSAIDDELSAFGSGITYQIAASRLSERQIIEYVEDFQTNFPEVLTEIPEITVTAYPNWNSIRKIITISFKYSRSRESLLAERMINGWRATPSPSEEAPTG